jgi:hypothetical protein
MRLKLTNLVITHNLKISVNQITYCHSELSVTTLSIKTLSIVTLSIMTLSVII